MHLPLGTQQVVTKPPFALDVIGQPLAGFVLSQQVVVVVRRYRLVINHELMVN